jgi:L-threonylcarbamoyladenylate synthase
VSRVSLDANRASITEAIEQLGDTVSVYLDAGPGSGAVPSTIVDLTGEPAILREGRLSVDELIAAVPGLFGTDA